MPEVVEPVEECEWCGAEVPWENLAAVKPLDKRGIVMCPNCIVEETDAPVKPGPNP